MKLMIKTLNQKTIEIEMDVERNVSDLKVEISKELGGDFTENRLKLICAGVVMDDAEKICNYNISPDKFIVVMVLRNDQTMDQAPSNQNSNTTIITTNSLTQLESNFLTGEDYEQAVNIMVEMGFERQNVEQAMAASFNNPERAFDYLTNGIPENIETSSQISATSPAAAQINSETVNQVLELLRQNPNLLQATLQQMGVNNTELLEQIRNNPDAFFDLMRQQTEQSIGCANVTPEQVITPTGLEEFRNSLGNAVGGEGSGGGGGGGGSGGGGSGGGGSGGGIQPSAAENIVLSAALQNFTPDDHAAIERLKAMGFQEVMAVQAYVAFDKNESLAADFLASNIDDQN